MTKTNQLKKDNNRIIMKKQLSKRQFKDIGIFHISKIFLFNLDFSENSLYLYINKSLISESFVSFKTYQYLWTNF